MRINLISDMDPETAVVMKLFVPENETDENIISILMDMFMVAGSKSNGRMRLYGRTLASFFGENQHVVVPFFHENFMGFFLREGGSVMILFEDHLR